jgi:hypothetical protein
MTLCGGIGPVKFKDPKIEEAILIYNYDPNSIEHRILEKYGKGAFEFCAKYITTLKDADITKLPPRAKVEKEFGVGAVRLYDDLVTQMSRATAKPE